MIELADKSAMQCYHVLVHGKLDWRGEPIPGDENLGAVKPQGFFCHRFVIAHDPEKAKSKALQRVRRNFENKTKWISLGFATLALEVEELNRAPLHRLLLPDNRGHTFYEKD